VEGKKPSISKTIIKSACRPKDLISQSFSTESKHTSTQTQNR